MPECDRCDREFDDLENVESLEASLCDACIRALMDDIEFRDWQDRYTEEQHERALSLLDDYDEFECIISSYEDGQVVIHTPYVTSDVVTDFCNHFGYKILSFGPQWSADYVWPCMDDHGDIFEVVLQYDHSCDTPIPLAAKFQENHIERIDGNDKQF